MTAAWPLPEDPPVPAYPPEVPPDEGLEWFATVGGGVCEVGGVGGGTGVDVGEGFRVSAVEADPGAFEVSEVATDAGAFELSEVDTDWGADEVCAVEADPGALEVSDVDTEPGAPDVSDVGVELGATWLSANTRLIPNTPMSTGIISTAMRARISVIFIDFSVMAERLDTSIMLSSCQVYTLILSNKKGSVP